MSILKNGSGNYVCATCLEDEGLQRFAREWGEPGSCNYCGESGLSTNVVKYDNVIAEMQRYILKEWQQPKADRDALESLDDYLSKYHNSESLFKKIDFTVSNPVLMQDFLNSFADHDWCRNKPPLFSNSMKWADQWEAFKSFVKYRRRYTFWQGTDTKNDKSSRKSANLSGILYQIKALLNRSKLVISLKPGYPFWRSQIFPANEKPKIPERFTAPPLKLAVQPNRMSPAGVPMFYGADDFETSCCELVDPRRPDLAGKMIIGVQFENAIRLNILDLTLIPLRKSYFVTDEPGQEPVLEFLREFAEDLSMPISPKNNLIEYVPTQVFTEFVRFMMKGPKGVPIHGIRYASSRTKRPCWVIFANQAECLQESSLRLERKKVRQILQHVNNSEKTTALPWELLE